MDGRTLVVLPRLDDGRIILLRRETDGDAAQAGGLWELPSCPVSGQFDHAETVAALLHSTTDYVPGRLSPLGAIDGAYLAEGLRPSPLPPAHVGRAMTTALPLAEVREMIRCGLIRCGTLLTAFALLNSDDTGFANAE
ncbi:MAG: hypothetical protein K0R39_2812 [Symbiobacteriaceae bacterium]|jgi:hypothetical protein|nr:hypothetical protein [Symbiobacteriaceae bacterium]